MKTIFLVEVIDGSNLTLPYCKSFTDEKKAKDYFTYLIGKFQISDDGEYIDECANNGYCDFRNDDGFDMSIIFENITLIDE